MWKKRFLGGCSRLDGTWDLSKKNFSDGEFYDLSDWDFSGIYGLHSLQQTSILPFFKT